MSNHERENDSALGEGLVKQLSVYSAAAGVVLALAPRADAVIHVFHPGAPLLVDAAHKNIPAQIDIDNDGAKDFDLSFNTGTISGPGTGLWINKELAANQFDGNGTYVRRLSQGSTVNAALNINHAQLLPNIWGNSSGYIGVKFRGRGGLIYDGWIHFTSSQAAPLAGSIDAWAYEDSGGAIKAGNTVPTISAIADQITNEDTATGAVPFTVGDNESLATDLVVTAKSSNWTLVPASNIVLGGSGTDRTVAITPVANQNGSTTITITASDRDLTTSTSFLLTVNAVNDPPVSTGQSITIPGDHPGYLIPLTATDVDGNPLTYSIVKKPSHGTVWLANAPNGFIYRPLRNYSGPDSLTFKASDALFYSNTSTVSITIKPVPHKPVADAGPDQKVRPGSVVTLSGANCIDVDGGALIYKWTQVSGPTVILSGPSLEKAKFTAPQASASLVFNLTVTDSTRRTATDRCIVNVSATTAQPVAEAGPDRKVAGGAVVTLHGSGSRGTRLSYLWTQIGGPTVKLWNPTTVNPSFTAPPAGKSGQSLSFLLTVKDSAGFQSDDVAIVNVPAAPNQPPVANSGLDLIAKGGTRVTLSGLGSTDNDVIASFKWSQVSGPPVRLSNPTLAKPTFTAPPVGAGGVDLVFRLIATDYAGLQSQDSCKVHVNP